MIVGVYATSKTSYRGGFAQAKPPLAVARNHGIRSKIEAREHETRRTEETRSKNRKQTTVFCLQYPYRILSENKTVSRNNLYTFKLKVAYLHIVSGLLLMRKWPTYETQTVHL